MEPNSPDSDAVELVQKLFIKHTHELRGYLFPLVADRNLLDDLLHTVFVTLTEEADRYDPSRSFLAWACGIARNKTLMAARQSRRAPRALSPDVIELLSVEVPDMDVQQARLDAVVSCVEELSPRAREAIVLRYSKSLRPTQIASSMSLAIDSVNVMLSRARQALRKCVELKLQASKGS